MCACAHTHTHAQAHMPAIEETREKVKTTEIAVQRGLRDTDEQAGGLGLVSKTGRQKEKVQFGDTVCIQNQSRADGPTSDVKMESRGQPLSRGCEREYHISPV